MNRFLAAVLLLLPMSEAFAADLGADIGLMPPPGWKSVEPFPPLLAPSPFATLKYVPADGRHAAIIITLLPPDVLGFPVKDGASLGRFTLIAAQPYLSANAPAPQVIEHGLPAGLAARITVPCPSKPDSTTSMHSFRMATTASLLLDSQHLVHFAILHEGDDAPEFQQAVQTIRSVHLRKSHATAMDNRDVRTLTQAKASVGH